MNGKGDWFEVQGGLWVRSVATSFDEKNDPENVKLEIASNTQYQNA